jgi:hypothetical protein
MANSFDNKSNERIARAVRTVEKSALNSTNYRRRSRARGGSGDGSASVEAFPFQTKMVFNGTTSLYDITVNGGQVVLPDSQEFLSAYTFSNSLGTEGNMFIYLKISGTQAGNGGWNNFIAVIEEQAINVQPPNTDDVNYFLLSYINIHTNTETNSITRTVSQERNTSFDSGGNIY